MLEQTTVEVIAINDHRKCHRGDHTTVIVIMPLYNVRAQNGIAQGSNYDKAKPQNGIAPTPQLT